MAIMKTDGTTNQGFQSWIIDPLKTNIYFLYSMGDLIKKEALKNASGSTFLEISNSEVKKLKIKYSSKPEQDKIGNLLSKLDNTLTLLQRKKKKYKALKKALLQNLFSKNKEHVPNLRFNGFNNDWYKQKLKYTNTFFTDGNYGEAYPKSSDFTNHSKGIPFLTGKNLKEGWIDNTSLTFITKKKHQELTSGHLIEDDIVIAVRGSLGALGYVNKKNVGWNINSQLAILRTDKTELNGKYLLQFLLSTVGHAELIKRQTGSALKQLPINAIKDISVPIISIKEQKKIAGLLSRLDSLILLLGKKIIILSDFKNFLLQNMFI